MRQYEEGLVIDKIFNEFIKTIRVWIYRRMHPLQPVLYKEEAYQQTRSVLFQDKLANSQQKHTCLGNEREPVENQELLCIPPDAYKAAKPETLPQ